MSYSLIRLTETDRQFVNTVCKWAVCWSSWWMNCSKLERCLNLTWRSCWEKRVVTTAVEVFNKPHNCPALMVELLGETCSYDSCGCLQQASQLPCVDGGSDWSWTLLELDVKKLLGETCSYNSCGSLQQAAQLPCVDDGTVWSWTLLELDLKELLGETCSYNSCGSLQQAAQLSCVDDGADWSWTLLELDVKKLLRCLEQWMGIWIALDWFHSRILTSCRDGSGRTCGRGWSCFEKESVLSDLLVDETLRDSICCRWPFWSVF